MPEDVPPLIQVSIHDRTAIRRHLGPILEVCQPKLVEWVATLILVGLALVFFGSVGVCLLSTNARPVNPLLARILAVSSLGSGLYLVVEAFRVFQRSPVLIRGRDGLAERRWDRITLVPY